MSTNEVPDPGPSGGSAGPPPGGPSDDRVVSDSAIEDAPGPTISEARPNITKKGQYFGMPKNRAAPVYLRPDDYEQKYPPDVIDEALGPNARVWRVYLDEAQAFDSNMIEGWKDTIDVLLVFAGLFSAVVTTFVVQTSQNLQPDYAEISALVLSELVGLQRAIADGKPAGSVQPSSQNATTAATFVAQKSDQWINGLWFTSLALSLATALMSVLVKQWLQYYMMPVSGTSQEQVHVRQFRYTSMKLWHVGGIIGCLPVLMHLALMLFYIGLVVLVVQLDIAIATVVAVVAGLVYIAYFATNIWAVINVQCPYKTPLSDFARLLLGIIRLGMYKMLSKLESFCLYIYKHQYITCKIMSDVHLEEEPAQQEKDTSTEKNVVQHTAQNLDMDALTWLSTISSNPSIIRIIYHSLAALDLDKHNAMILLSTSAMMHCYTDNHFSFFKMSDDRFKTLWTDIMICTTYLKYTRSTPISHEAYHHLYWTSREVGAIYEKILSIASNINFSKMYPTTYKLEKYTAIFQDLSQLSNTKISPMVPRILHFVTHFILIQAMSSSELVQVSLLYIKATCPIAPNFKYQKHLMERLCFLLTHSFATTTRKKISYKSQFHEIKREIFLTYFNNIDKWIDDISEIDFDYLINYFVDNWVLVRNFDYYLELSSILFNCERLYSKLTQPQLRLLVIKFGHYLFPNFQNRYTPQYMSLNGNFLYALYRRKYQLFDDVEYCVTCLQILNHSAKFSFWYSHDVMDIIPYFALDKLLWKLANQFISHIYDEVLYKPSNQFLQWYNKLFLKYLEGSTEYTICDSKFLQLMGHSLEQPIWTEFLISVIKEYNQALCKLRGEVKPDISITSVLYFEQLMYLSQMKRKLNISPTDSRFTLYAYVGGKDLGLLKYLDNAQYAPYSIVFELKHIESESHTTSHKPISKLQSANLVFKAAQKALRIGRASKQMQNAQLPV